MKKRGKTKLFLLAAIAAVILAILAYAGFILFIRIPELMKNSGQPEFASVYGKMPWERLVTVQPYENITSATVMTPDNIFFPQKMVIGKMEFSGTPSDTERIKLFNSIPLAPPYPVTATFNDNRTAVFDKDAWQINWHSGNFAYQLHAAITDNPARPDGINSLLRLFPFPAPEGKADFDCAISAEKLSGNASFAGSFGDESGRFSADSDITLDGQTFIFKSLHYKNSSGGVAIDFAPAAVTVKPNGEYQLSGKISAFALNTPTAKLSLTGEAEFSGVWRNGQLPEISFGGATLKDGSISGALEQIKVENPSGAAILRQVAFASPGQIDAAEFSGNFGGINIEAQQCSLDLTGNNGIAAKAGQMTVSHGTFTCGTRDTSIVITAQEEGKTAVSLQSAELTAAIDGFTPIHAVNAGFGFNAATQLLTLDARQVSWGDDITSDDFSMNFTIGKDMLSAKAGKLNVNAAKFHEITGIEAAFSTAEGVEISVKPNSYPVIKAKNITLAGKGLQASFPNGEFSLDNTKAVWKLSGGKLKSSAPLPELELHNLTISGGNHDEIGDLSADSVTFNGYNLGRITAVDRQNGCIYAEAADGAKTEFHFSRDIFDLDRIKLVLPKLEHRKMPFAGVTLTGQLEVEGNLATGNTLLTAKFKGDITMPGVEIKSAATAPELTDFNLSSSRPFQQLSAQSINFHGIPLEDVSASYMLDNGKLKLQLMTARVWGGSLTLTPSPDPEDQALNFMTYGIDGSSLARFLGFKDAEIDGSFEGMLSFMPGKFPDFNASSLVTTPGRTGKITVSAFPQVVADDLSMQISRAALAGFTYNFIRFDFNGDRVKFTADGSPDEPIPFVADPVTGAFRPAADTEPGFDRELTVEMDFKPHLEK